MGSVNGQFLVDNGAGYKLSIRRTKPSGTSEAAPRRPVLIVPGYGMNSFIFDFHPRGPSLVASLAARGLEVWTVDMRGQGRSIRTHGSDRYGLAELAVEDLGATIRHVLDATETKATHLDLIGCSLGTALSFAHVACVPDAPVHAVVSMAGLVTWKAAHPLVRLAFGSPRVAGMVRVKHVRSLARTAVPTVVKFAPRLLSLYLNHVSTDLSRAEEMIETVEDPHPMLNREIAEWIARQDLVVRGVNVSEKLKELTHPFMCVVANNDGIVLPRTSRHTFDVIGSKTKRLLEVGDRKTPIAHGDLFLCTGAQTKIFEPIADFLLDV